MRTLLLIVALVGCQFAKDVGGEVGGRVAEYTACPIGLFDCGHVFMCEASADNALGHVEICINDDEDGQFDAAETVYGPCVPTPRHAGLCKWCHGPDCGRGCNAFTGCFYALP